MYISGWHLFFAGLSIAVFSAVFSSYIQFKLNYNLWDWLMDKYNAFRGRVVYDTHVVIKLTSAEYHHLTDALDKIPAAIRWAIRRR